MLYVRYDQKMVFWGFRNPSWTKVV